MQNIVARLHNSHPNEGSHELACRCVDAAIEIERLRAALTEARRWIGDGEFSDGLHDDYWTPEYRAAVAMVDAVLAPNEPAKGPPSGGPA